MFKIKGIPLFILISVLFLSCINNGQDGTTAGPGGGPDYSDPDPLAPEEIASAPKSPSSLLVAVNIDGEIRVFQADAPADYSVILNEACTDQYFEKFRLSGDGKYLLYVSSEKDLVLYNIGASSVADILQEDVSCDEIQFIDNDKIQYSHGGDIYCYTISTGLKYVMINDPELQCNHGAVVSPDGSRIVFKNQDPNQTGYAVYALADVTGETVDTCTYLGDYTGDIALLELFEFVWIANDKLFLKPSVGLNTRIKAYTIGGSIPLNANVTVDGSVIQFTRLTVSDDLSRSKLCIYGSFGLYQVDLTSLDFDSQIEVHEIYKSEVITTKFADYSSDSNYLVAATSGCIGIYKADSLEQTDFDSTEIISEGETLYYLCCN